MAKMMPHTHIIGTGSSIPKRILSNKDLEGIVDTTDEWIIQRTGIKERRISVKGERESTTDLTTQASVKAIEMAGISPKSLDMIVVGTVTGDRMFPSTACMVQEALNAENAMAFDVSAGCTGFLYALSMADNAIQCGTCKNALVVGVDRLSSVVNWQDRGTCVLLADGAGAVVVTSATEQGGILSTHLKSDGKLWELLYSSDGNNHIPKILQGIDIKPFHLRMDGNRLFKRAVGYLSSIANEALEHNSLTIKDIGLLVPHQANIRIIKAVSKNLYIPMERVYTNIHRYGNTSSASIPIALDEANRENMLSKGDHVLFVSFGAGLTWGASIVRWSI
ncbi:MAG: ketoacyl-ACP synthase III [Deltaproteobacteria bacterium]|nr:ketoacyl-ACP synthase III [Deltaproteobacteria bacterium]MCD6266111.1 ketoacyl-ACP synthase III [Deltaproteobacteria bacterium]